jgi:hypothetical protein
MERCELLIMVKQNKKQLTDSQSLWMDYWINNQDDILSTPFKQTSDDNSVLADLLIMGGIVAGAYTVGSLLDAQQQLQVQNEIKDVQSTAPDELMSQIGQTPSVLEDMAMMVSPDTGVSVSGDVYQYLTQDDLNYYTLSQDDISQYQSLQDELSMYGRVSDKDSVDNIAFNNAQNIQEQIGLFGATEGNVQGTLEPFKGQDVLIPWETMGDDKVCDDCEQAEADGPYKPDEYPGPQHYGDRCTPGVAELAGD